jgi:hypothetical protein
MIKCLWSEIMTNYTFNEEESVESLIPAFSMRILRNKLKSRRGLTFESSEKGGRILNEVH